MNKTVLWLMFLLVFGFAYGLTIESSTNTNLLYSCYNITSSLVDTAANFNCTTNDGTSVAVALTAMTNRGTGLFNVTINLAPGAYNCYINCNSGVDYWSHIYSKTSEVNSAKESSLSTLGTVINRTEVGLRQNGTIISRTETGLSQNGTVILGAITNNHTSTKSFINSNTSSILSAIDTVDNYVDSEVSDILADTNAVDTADELEFMMSSVLSNLSVTHDSGNWSATSASSLTEGGIADAVWDEQLSGHTTDGSASKNLTGKVESTSACDLSRVQGAIDQNFSLWVRTDAALSGNASYWNVWDDVSRTLTTADWTTDADLATMQSALSQNASNWFVSTYQTRVDAAITTRSSHSAADVDALISDEQTLTAVEGNATVWDNVADVSGLCTQTDMLAIGVDVNTSLTNEDSIYTAVQENNATLKSTSFGLSALKDLIDALNDITAADVWASATRTIQYVINPTNITTTGIQAIDTQLNSSHSTGNWSDVGIGSSLTVQDIDSALNVSHPGNWSGVGSATATISASDKAEIIAGASGNVTSVISIANILNGTATCTNYAASSLGCTVYSIETYTR